MLSQAENERITRTGPGTPMGNAMRRYWIPVCLSSELPEPDCPPIRQQLLNERLVAFRDISGQIGLLGEHCPHRGASLYFGRNEECGLRCVYHGWKFDLAGKCVDMPDASSELLEAGSETPPEPVRATAYPCQESGGVVWAYLGPPETIVPLPSMEWMRAKPGQSYVCKHLNECNWVQVLEGGLDPIHAFFLHRPLQPGETYEQKMGGVTRSSPKIQILETEFGYRSGSIYPAKDRVRKIRVTSFAMPFYQIRYTDDLEQGHMWVPIDDESCWVYNWLYRSDGAILDEEKDVIRAERRGGREPANTLPGFRFKQNRDNDYLLDREAQRTKSMTGIYGIGPQDAAVQESEGPIFDRSIEHLGTSDLNIIAMRKLLLEACADVEAGRPPRGSQLRSIDERGLEGEIPADTADWYEAVKAALAARW